MRPARLAASALALGTLLAAGTAHAQQQFDGRWSVEIVTEKGDCDRAYRYAVAIEKGRVRYAGEAGFNISGQVAPNGSVSGSISRGDARATYSGRLSGNNGSGSWTASGGSRTCSGNWNADK